MEERLWSGHDPSGSKGCVGIPPTEIQSSQSGGVSHRGGTPRDDEERVNPQRLRSVGENVKHAVDDFRLVPPAR